MKFLFGKLKDFLKKYWIVFAVLAIFYLAYYIRAMNVVPDKLLSYDPIFEYRNTKYVVDFGNQPAWDELTYYVGRKINPDYAGPFLFYLTALIHSFLKNFGFSLLTTASYMAAIYGALLIFPAFFLGREVSNKYGGLLAALMVGTAPQILIRTFGGSFDTDQFVLFFILTTLYLGLRCLRKRTIGSVALASLGFIAAMLNWGLAVYTFFILIAAAFFHFLIQTVSGNKDNKNLFDRLSAATSSGISDVKILISILVIWAVAGFILDFNLAASVTNLLGFAQKAEVWIVTVSIAELQPFNVFNLEGWMLAMGRFVTQDSFVDMFILFIFALLIISSLIFSYKKDARIFSFLLTIAAVGVFTTTRGIRFTEFSSALFITLVAAGFGYALERFRNDRFVLSSVLGIGLVIAFLGFGLGSQLGTNLGPDSNSNWDEAWKWIKENTPESSIIGTWWDPGHMIAGLAERRNFADGAHCDNNCLYTINDRITDLGKIMSIEDEEEAIKLINKYKGNSEKVYWIASDDLLGKYQWMEYFGLGCDARKDPKCPLYLQLQYKNTVYSVDGRPIMNDYGNVLVFQGNAPLPVALQGRNVVFLDEVIFYNENGTLNYVPITDKTRSELLETLKPAEKELNLRFSNQSVPYAAWIPASNSYVVLVPPALKNTIFTKLFLYEGAGLNRFKQVFRNEQVKIYEVLL